MKHETGVWVNGILKFRSDKDHLITKFVEKHIKKDNVWVAPIPVGIHLQLS